MYKKGRRGSSKTSTGSRHIKTPEGTPLKVSELAALQDLPNMETGSIRIMQIPKDSKPLSRYHSPSVASHRFAMLWRILSSRGIPSGILRCSGNTLRPLGVSRYISTGPVREQVASAGYPEAWRNSNESEPKESKHWTIFGDFGSFRQFYRSCCVGRHGETWL